MIFGLVQSRSASAPAWLSKLELRPGGLPGGTVHLGLRGRASSHRRGALSVVAEHGAVRWGLDADAIAEAYRRFGHGCVGRLRGRFRFILHDASVEQLLAASSTAPHWPLAYWWDSRTTVVCSRLWPLLRCPDVPRGLDESYLVQLVMGLSAMREGSTAVRGVRRLCPGEALIVDGACARVSRVDRLTPRDPGTDRKRFGRMFMEELGQAVSALTASSPTVVSLSGGLDSAVLAGAARSTDLAALSFVAPALDASAEIGSIDSMEHAWPTLRVERVDASDATELPELGPELRDDPQLTPLALLPGRMLLWSRAREVGFQTVIEAEGGDELFSMLPTPLDSLRSGHLLAAVRHVRQSSGRRALVEYAALLPMLPTMVQRAWLRRRNQADAHLPAFAVWGATEHPLIHEALREYFATFVHRPFEDRLNEWMSAPAVVGASLSRRHIAAGFGLELEWPLLERPVLELVLGLHAAGAIRGGAQKPFLQEAALGVVPDDVRLLSKSVGLYEAFIPGVLTSPRARAALRDVRVRRRLTDLVRFDRVEAMLDRLAAGRALGTAALWHLECVVSFSEWYARASREYGVD